MSKKRSIFQKNQQKIVFLTFFLGFLHFFQANAQKNQQNQILELPESILLVIEDYIEASGGENSVDVLELYELLENVYQKKLDINSVDKRTLESLQLLSDVQVNNFFRYRDRLGPFLSIYELQAIPEMDYNSIQRIVPFIQKGSSVTQESKRKIFDFSNSQNEIIVRSQRNVETLAGSEEGSLLGDPFRHFFRYRLQGDQFKIGVLAEKDVGEKGVDFLSYHVALQNISKSIKELYLGDYTVSMGQGLILHNQFGGGLSSFTTNIKRRSQSFRQYTARNEVNFFRGVATSVQIKDGWTIKAFGSHNYIDGSLKDVDDDGVIESFSSIDISGNHRTESELERKDGIKRTSIGGILEYKTNSTSVHLNALNESFNLNFERTLRPDNIFFPRTSNFQNVSLDFTHLWKGFNLFGESALSSAGGSAHLIGALISLHPQLDLAMSYRNYAKDYIALNPNSFGQGSNSNNERGSYVGLEYRYNNRLSVNAYADVWTNPWLRFRVDSPGNGTDYLLKINYNIKRKLSSYFLFKTENRLRNSSADSVIDFTSSETISRARIHVSYVLSKSVRIRSRLEYSKYSNDTESPHGLMFYQDFIFKPIELPFSVVSRIMWFDVDDFDARIYAYENDVLSDFSVPFFSDNGIRYYVNLRYKPTYRITAELRVAQSRFFDRDTISSGVTEIDGNVSTNVKAQVRYRF